MTTITCTVALVVAVLTIPVMVLLYYTATPQQHARRWRKAGQTYKSIAQRLNTSPTTARRWCLS